MLLPRVYEEHTPETPWSSTGHYTIEKGPSQETWAFSTQKSVYLSDTDTTVDGAAVDDHLSLDLLHEPTTSRTTKVVLVDCAAVEFLTLNDGTNGNRRSGNEDLTRLKNLEGVVAVTIRDDFHSEHATKTTLKDQLMLVDLVPPCNEVGVCDDVIPDVESDDHGSGRGTPAVDLGTEGCKNARVERGEENEVVERRCCTSHKSAGDKVLTTKDSLKTVLELSVKEVSGCLLDFLVLDEDLGTEVELGRIYVGLTNALLGDLHVSGDLISNNILTTYLYSTGLSLSEGHNGKETTGKTFTTKGLPDFLGDNLTKNLELGSALVGVSLTKACKALLLNLSRSLARHDTLTRLVHNVTNRLHEFALRRSVDFSVRSESGSIRNHGAASGADSSAKTVLRGSRNIGSSNYFNTGTRSVWA